jgi:photosystem II stability/assembly factor-like uncharacterized protein
MAELDRLEERLREHLRRSAEVPDGAAGRVVAAVRARLEEAPRRRPLPALAGVASGVVLAGVLGAALWSRTGAPSGAERPRPPAGVQPGVGASTATRTVFSVLDVAFGDDLHGWEVGGACMHGGCVLAVRATADAGRTWTAPSAVDPRPPGADATAQVAFHGPRSGFVAAGGLFTSGDGGRTWSRTALPAGVVAVAPLNGSVWALQACPGSPPCPVRMLVSTDGGRDWAGTATQPGVGGPDATMVRVSATDAFVSGSEAAGRAGSRLSATHDGGRTWTPLPDPCGPSLGAAAPALAALEPTELWVACEAPAGRSVLRSRDGGRHWEPRASAAPGAGPLGAGGSLSALALAPRGPIYLGLEGGPLLRSGDGSAWTVSLDATSAGGVRRVEFLDTTHGWVVTGDGRALGTADGGRTWIPLAP